MTAMSDSWPAGATWVFQGTVLEDATAGTHISSLTVTPGAGNEMQLLYGEILAGAGAANLCNAQIDDGANVITDLIPRGFSLASGAYVNFPNSIVGTASGNVSGPPLYPISGTMRLQLRVSTATVSLTHTFAVACRIKGALPTATLADTVGVPTLTTNTNQVF